MCPFILNEVSVKLESWTLMKKNDCIEFEFQCVIVTLWSPAADNSAFYFLPLKITRSSQDVVNIVSVLMVLHLFPIYVTGNRSGNQVYAII